MLYGLVETPYLFVQALQFINSDSKWTIFLTGIIMRKDNYEYSDGYDEYIKIMMLMATVIFSKNSLPHA